jgi:hypothetical protein
MFDKKKFAIQNLGTKTVAALTLLFPLISQAPARAQDNRVVGTPGTARAPIPMPTSSLPSVTKLISDILSAERANNANDLVLAYGNSVRDPQLARGALSALLYDFYNRRALAASAPQASQAVDETLLRFSIFQAAQNQVQVQQSQQALELNQRLVEQNDILIRQNARSIALLEQIARNSQNSQKTAPQK